MPDTHGREKSRGHGEVAGTIGLILLVFLRLMQGICTGGEKDSGRFLPDDFNDFMSVFHNCRGVANWLCVLGVFIVTFGNGIMTSVLDTIALYLYVYL